MLLPFNVNLLNKSTGFIKDTIPRLAPDLRIYFSLIEALAVIKDSCCLNITPGL